MKLTKISDRVYDSIEHSLITDKGFAFYAAKRAGEPVIVTPNREFVSRQTDVYNQTRFSELRVLEGINGPVFISDHSVYSLEEKLFDLRGDRFGLISSTPDIIVEHSTGKRGILPEKESISVNGVEGQEFRYLFDVELSPLGLIYYASNSDGIHCYVGNEVVGPEGAERPFIHKGKIGWVWGPKGTWEGDCQVFWNGQKFGPEQGIRDQHVHSIGENIVFKGQAGKLFVSPKKNPTSIYGMLDVSWSSDFLVHAFVNNEHLGSANSVDIENIAGKPAFAFHFTDKDKRFCETVFNGRTMRYDSYAIRMYNAEGELAVVTFIPNNEDLMRYFISDQEIFSVPHRGNEFGNPVIIKNHLGGFFRTSEHGKLETMIDGKIIGEPIPAECYFPNRWDTIAFDGMPAGRFIGRYGARNYFSACGQSHGPFRAVSIPCIKGNSLYFIVSKDDGTYLAEVNQNGKKNIDSG